MKEWSTIYNPFNSIKNLVHAKNFEAIIDRKKILPPIVVNFDLTNVCNYNCSFCMFANRDRTDKTGKDFRASNASLEKGYALKLPRLWKRWGVKAVCLGGGGDPTCHPDLYKMMKEIKKYGLDIGMPSNGYLINSPEHWKTINECCKWIGFSIDAGCKDDYAKTKGVSKEWFNVIINNLRNIAETKKAMGTKLNVGYKFLIEPTNYTSIYKAIKLAHNIGCNTIQIRPSINPNQKLLFKEHGAEIFNQIGRGRKEFEDENFKVMGITHKFTPSMEKKHDFNLCRATMLTTTWCADGKVYLCTDTRGNKWAYLGDHYPNPKKFIKFWGSKQHWDIVDKIDFKKCDRCTLCFQNEAFEKIFIEDKMERNLI